MLKRTIPRNSRITGLILSLLVSLACGSHALAQAVNASQQVIAAGLRSNGIHGSFPAAAYAPDGSLVVLYDGGDGVRVLHLDATGMNLLSETHLGSAGDVPVALAVDPQGNLYVAGLSTSGTLSGTTGAAFPSRADTSTNSFLLRLKPDLSLAFLTFLGAGRTAATSVAATANAAFVTGSTFNLAFPTTANAVEPSAPPGSTQSGFVERFDSSGALSYATYLGGANGNTAPASIAADTAGNAYIAGSTSATGFLTVSALVPRSPGGSSGFLTRLSAAGDSITFSTFIPGTGITGLALDSSSASLLLSGNVAIGQFPITTVSAPIAKTSYQSLIRIPLDGQSVTASSLLVPGNQSFVSSDASGAAWVSGPLAIPLFPGSSQPLALFGDGFALHVRSNGTVDQTLRFGASVPSSSNNPFTITPGQPAAVSAAVVLPATFSENLSSTATQQSDIPLRNAPSPALPNIFRDSASACTAAQCYVTAGYLTVADTTNSYPSLSISADTAPNVRLRNLGTAAQTALQSLPTGSPSPATAATHSRLRAFAPSR